MTDKVQKIRAFLVGIADADGVSTILAKAIEKEILPYIDSLQEEPVSEEWIEELRTKLDLLSKGDFEKVWGKYGAEEKEEPVSDDLEEEALVFSATDIITEDGKLVIDSEKVNAFKAGAKWQKEQFEKDYTNLCKGIATVKGLAVTMAYDKGVADTKEQMMAKAVDAMIGLPYENKDGGYTHLIDVSRPLPVGNNKIAIIFKKE